MTEAEVELLGRVGTLDCDPLQRLDGEGESGYDAAIECRPDDDAVSRLTLFSFEDIDALRTHWLAQVDAFDPALEESDDACTKGSIGVRGWGYGIVACRRDQETRAIHWFDRRGLIYGVVEGDGTTLRRLFSWWQEEGRRIGRRVGEATGGAPTERPDVAAQSVGSASTAVICDAASPPISDARGRTWRVEKVTFRDLDRFERVTFHLARTGRDRKSGSVLVVESVPTSQVKSRVPEASRPVRGRNALLISMAAITDSLSIQGYRPTGVDLVKELSLMRTAGSTTALVAVPRDICYRVRVPAWGASATGEEQRAKIFIDIQK